MNAQFDLESLGLSDEVKEVHIETRRDEGSPMHSTIVWTVVVEGEVFVRSVRGSKGRWYRELVANPTGALRVDGNRIAVGATPATEDPVTQTVSDAYRSKYGRYWPGPTAAMVRPDILPTTLRLSPA